MNRSVSWLIVCCAIGAGAPLFALDQDSEEVVQLLAQVEQVREEWRAVKAEQENLLAEQERDNTQRKIAVAENPDQTPNREAEVLRTQQQERDRGRMALRLAQTAAKLRAAEARVAARRFVEVVATAEALMARLRAAGFEAEARGIENNVGRFRVLLTRANLEVQLHEATQDGDDERVKAVQQQLEKLPPAP